jgi:hypothetical protein
MAVKELLRSYVRDNYPNKVPLLPRAKSSKKRPQKKWRTEFFVPELWQTVPTYLSKRGLPTGNERVGIKAVSA